MIMIGQSRGGGMEAPQHPPMHLVSHWSVSTNGLKTGFLLVISLIHLNQTISDPIVTVSEHTIDLGLGSATGPIM